MTQDEFNWDTISTDEFIERGGVWRARALSAEKQVAELERWKAEATTLLNIIYDYTNNHPECKAGMSQVQFAVDRASQYDELIQKKSA